MKSDRGSVSIEASLVLFTFLLGFLAVNFMALNALVETRTKLLLDNACVDLNNYIYFNDRLKIVDEQKADEYIDKLLDKNKIEIEGVEGRTIRNNPVTLRLKIKVLMGKYLERPLDEFFNDLGISRMSFLRSRVLDDNKNIEVVMEYDLDYQLFSLFRRKRHLVQVCHLVTHRPLLEKDQEDEKGQEKSMWQESNFTRGKYYVNEIRQENKGQICKTGQKIDLYDESGQTLTEIFSVNLFTSSYSSLDNGSYRLKEDYVKKFLEDKALKLYDDIEDLKGSIEMEEGTIKKLSGRESRQIILVVPEEAVEFAKELDLIRRDILKKNNTKIILKYRDKALL